MKQIVRNYSFDKTARTVTFTDFGSISLDRLLLITNVTSNVVVYQFNNPSLGGTVAGNVLTLTYNTSAMNNGDKLQIIYDSTVGDPTYDATGTMFVVGSVASGSADSGNPVKVGGRYNSAAPTLTNGQRGDLQLDASGNLKVAIAAGAGGSTAINDGTTTANNLAGDTGQNAQLVAGARKEVAFTTTTVQAVGTTDVSNYQWVSLQIVTQGTSASVAFQASNDGTNWIAQTLYSSAGTATVGVTSSTAAAIMYHGPLAGRYFRLNVTGISAGTTAGTLQFFTSPRGLPVTGVAGSGLSSAVAIQSVKGSTTTNQPTLYVNFGANLAGSAKTSAGNIYAFTVSSLDTALVYFQLFNSTTAPSGGATPVYSFVIPAGSATAPSIRTMGEDFFSLTGRNFSSGIAWGISTTIGTYTAATTASNYSVHIHYA